MPDPIVGCSCPGCGQFVIHVAGKHTASGNDEFWRYTDEDSDCTTCRERPEDAG